MRPWIALLSGVLLLLGGTVGAAAAPRPPEAGLRERIWPDESIYFIMIDRFNNGDTANDGDANPADIRAWHGGDLQGIIDKLEYIKSLGFTTLWITPHVKNTGRDYHGYGAVDFFETDPHFGTAEQTRELVKQAHAKGLKVIFDVVVNHTGPQNPLVTEKPDWFHSQSAITNWNDSRQLQEGWIFNLPDFDQSSPAVREYILAYSRFWIEQTGVDGFRLDTVRHVPPEFFTWYNSELQKIKPGFWLLGEVWEHGPARLAIYQKAGVTALLDFPGSEAARKVFARDTSMGILGAAALNADQSMPDPWQMAAFLDNHDMARFVSEAKDDPVERLKLGLAYLFTQRSIPVVYYGTEIAMPGKNDPFNRVDFPWGNEGNPEVQGLVRELNGIRRAHVALRRGRMEELLTDRWQYAFARVAGGDKVVVVLNNSGTDRFTGEVEVSGAGITDGATLQDLLSGQTVTVAKGRIRPDLGTRSAAIYVAKTEPRGAVALGAAFVALAAVLVAARRRGARIP